MAFNELLCARVVQHELANRAETIAVPYTMMRNDRDKAGRAHRRGDHHRPGAAVEDAHHQFADAAKGGGDLALLRVDKLDFQRGGCMVGTAMAKNNQAALQASRQQQDVITLATLEWAKDKILMGAERKKAVEESARLRRELESNSAAVQSQSGAAVEEMKKVKMQSAELTKQPEKKEREVKDMEQDFALKEKELKREMDGLREEKVGLHEAYACMFVYG